MIRALIAEDEDLARLQMVRLLQAEPDVEIAGEAANGIEALEMTERLQPDVIFLDVEMPGLSGFDVLANLSYVPLIVFATAFDEYAVRAFEANAVDYLLKPIQPQRLAQSLVRLRLALEGRSPALETAFRRLLAEIGHRSPGFSRMAVFKNKRIVLVPLKDVLHAGIEEKLVFLYTATERYLSNRTLAELEEMLAGAGFFRISRGEIVNLEHIREIVPWFSGTLQVKLSNGRELSVTRDRAKQLKQQMRL